MHLWEHGGHENDLAYSNIGEDMSIMPIERWYQWNGLGDGILAVEAHCLSLGTPFSFNEATTHIIDLQSGVSLKDLDYRVTFP